MPNIFWIRDKFLGAVYTAIVINITVLQNTMALGVTQGVSTGTFFWMIHKAFGGIFLSPLVPPNVNNNYRYMRADKKKLIVPNIIINMLFE